MKEEVSEALKLSKPFPVSPTGYVVKRTIPK